MNLTPIYDKELGFLIRQNQGKYMLKKCQHGYQLGWLLTYASKKIHKYLIADLLTRVYWHQQKKAIDVANFNHYSSLAVKIVRVNDKVSVWMSPGIILETPRFIR